MQVGTKCQDGILKDAASWTARQPDPVKGVVSVNVLLAVQVSVQFSGTLIAF